MDPVWAPELPLPFLQEVQMRHVRRFRIQQRLFFPWHASQGRQSHRSTPPPPPRGDVFGASSASLPRCGLPNPAQPIQHPSCGPWVSSGALFRRVGTPRARAKFEDAKTCRISEARTKLGRRAVACHLCGPRRDTGKGSEGSGADRDDCDGDRGGWVGRMGCGARREEGGASINGRKEGESTLRVRSDSVPSMQIATRKSRMKTAGQRAHPPDRTHPSLEMCVEDALQDGTSSAGRVPYLGDCGSTQSTSLPFRKRTSPVEE
eukprot:scaffold1671_cov344-Pavlova_lutheri.AAC.7